MSGIPPVLVATTGGTIAAGRDPGTGHIVLGPGGSLPWQALGSERVTHLELAMQPSTATMPEQVLDWYSRLRDARTPDAPVVLTVGTNTLEEVAYLLDLVHREEWSLVVTGAMRPSDHPAADGPGNVADAVAVARSDEARRAGVVAVMDEHVFPAHGLRKVAGQGVAAFACAWGPLGHVDGSSTRNVHWVWQVRRRVVDLEPRIDQAVELVPAAMGASGDMITAACARGARGLVVEGFAGGDVTPGMGLAIAEAIAGGVAVVLADSGPARPGTAAYDGVGEGAWLARQGVVRAEGLSGKQARLLLMLALGQPGGDWARAVERATA